MARASKRAAIMIPLLLLVLHSGCSSYELWPKTESFLDQLRCGMTVQEAARVAASYPDLRFNPATLDSVWDAAATFTNTTIFLDFESGGLARAEVIWDDGILHSSSLPVREYCSNSKEESA